MDRTRWTVRYALSTRNPFFARSIYWRLWTGAHLAVSGRRSAKVRFNGWSWPVAPGEVADCNDWKWDADEIAIDEDQDHTGWYLAYKVGLGINVNVELPGH
jgi:hypothetical protein